MQPAREEPPSSRSQRIHTMKTDRLCFPLVTLAVVAAMILALIDPSTSHRNSHANVVVTATSN